MAPPSPYRPSDAADPLAPVVPPPELADRWFELRERVRRSPTLAGALVGGVVVLAAATWWLLRPPAAPLEAELPRAEAAAVSAVDGSAGSGSGADGAGAAAEVGEADQAASTAVPSTEAALVVQASGAVVHPGVYRLAVGARVDDLVRAAGGLTPGADGDRVNLAAPVADGERVWLPRRGEGDPPALVAGGGSSAPTGGGAGGGGSGPDPAPAGPVDLNTATAEQLDTLPGVGPATAAAILAYRTAHGRFGAVEELLDVRGIGDAKLEQLRPLVTT